MVRTILIYGALLAAGAFGLQWLEFQFVVRTHTTETYLVLIAIAFMGWGLGRRATVPPFGCDEPFEAQHSACAKRWVSADREFEVLHTAGAGPLETRKSPKQLDVSPNTVKTHCRQSSSKSSRRNDAPRPFRGRVELGMLQ
jgi:hypothetical protein